MNKKILGKYALQSGESDLIFRRNIVPLSPGPKNKANKEEA
jgi:hypothetical protein